MTSIPTNKEYTTDNTKFIDACFAGEVKPTPRQASKFRNKKGKTYNLLKGIKMEGIN